MRLELYQAETARIAAEQTALLDEARDLLMAEKSLSRLEQNGVLHALQLLVENSIGKAKHLLKAEGRNVPVSAYDTFADLAKSGTINPNELTSWQAAIGLRNRIVHDYMNIDMDMILDLIRKHDYQFITAFLYQPIIISD